MLVIMGFVSLAKADDVSSETLLITALQKSGLKQQECNIVLPLIKPLLEESELVKLLETANKVAIDRNYEVAMEAAKTDPTDSNLITFAEAYKAKDELRRYEAFYAVLRAAMGGSAFDDVVNMEIDSLHSELLGLRIAELSESMVVDMGLNKGTTGVLVSQVDDGSPSDRSGLSKGIVIESIQSRLIRNPKDFNMRMAQAKEGDKLLFGFWQQKNGRWARAVKVVRLITCSQKESANELVNVCLGNNGGKATAISEGTYLGKTQHAFSAIDGDKSTGWASSWNMPAWLQVDFGQEVMVEKVGVAWGPHNHTFSILLSLDGKKWEAVVESRKSNTNASYDGGNYIGAKPSHEVFPIKPTRAKFIKINVTSTSAPRSHIFQAIIHELEAYAKPAKTK